MDKKGINEVRRLFTKNDCAVDRMVGCYVNEQKERIAELSDSFHVLQDEEMFKYCDIFKKALSGRIGKTLFNMDFPLAEEKEGGHQPELYKLLKSRLKDEALISEFFDKIIAAYVSSEKYLILLVHGVYDIPGRASDGLRMEDASENVYEFMQLSICPVTLVRDGLCFDAEAQTFMNRTEDWAVQMPDMGLLYPAFNERNTDLHAAVWYAKKEECRHEELSEALLGMQLPRPGSVEKDVFHEVIEMTLGDACGFEAVRDINQAVNELLEEGKDSPEPVVVDRTDIKKILYNNGVDDETIERFDSAYDEVMGENAEPVLAENIAEPKKMTIKNDHLKLDVNAEAAELIETRIIDGMEYFLIPVSDNVTVNGIRIRSKNQAE